MAKIESLEIRETGRVKEVKKGVIKIAGLSSCINGQLVEINDTLRGMIIGFSPKDVTAIILGDERQINVGDNVFTKEESFTIPVGQAFCGRIVNSLALPCDNLGPIKADEYYSVFRDAPAVLDREPIYRTLETGIRLIDAVIPIGRGQRELIIADRVTGKSSIAIDTIINQKGKNVICVYCWVGASFASFVKLVDILKRADVLDYTVIVCAPAGASPAEQYVAPYTAATLGEYFMRQGKDVLVTFDDLTKHAWVYRELSLLLERSPGREAYPGDVFYLHSQLMERAGQLNQELGGGSMTFLPIVETQQGDVTGYIPSNLVSMTDGQIYLNSAAFREGARPAIDIGLSVSRIGSKVQSPALKEVSKQLRREYAQYAELKRLTKLKMRVSRDVTEKIKRGQTLSQIFIQPCYKPSPLIEQIVLFYAFNRNILEVLPYDVLEKFKTGIYNFLESDYPAIVEKLKDGYQLTDGIRSSLDQALVAYFEREKVL